MTVLRTFDAVVQGPIDRVRLSTLQINVGKRCNQACLHCHVNAGPKRTEMMDAATSERLIHLMDTEGLETVDITGGAPELNPHFRDLVRAARSRGLHVIDRCNLTVLCEPGQEDTAQFLADHDVEVVASLPCYSEKNVDSQRGRGVFGRSIQALQHLNTLGYGTNPDRVLNLVYNPGGAFLPPAQASLEADYKRRLQDDFGIVFNHLFTLTNMPIARFLEDLNRSGQHSTYMQTLLDAFNPQTVSGLMCREQISVSWDGRLFDCDFNQMLELPTPGKHRTIWDVESLNELCGKHIATAAHCFGCTAGAGSSCGGSLAAS